MDADAVLVNLISGSDLELDALRDFRRQSEALIYLDFHSRALGIDENGRRFYRRPADWQDWINQADVLQLNEKEARTLADSAFEAEKDELVSFGRAVLNNHPSICHLTLAEEGSFLFYQADQMKHCLSIEPFEIDIVLDVIGCGDAFAAGFIMHYLANRNVDEATRFATKVAALNCTFIGSSGVKQIQKLLWQV
jgi:sugar/nucleoside kinase (ribokinase family)